ncbi:MAG: hypothetical protein RhofKO_25820 [Rhodothermales bacterium]
MPNSPTLRTGQVIGLSLVSGLITGAATVFIIESDWGWGWKAGLLVAVATIFLVFQWLWLNRDPENAQRRRAGVRLVAAGIGLAFANTVGQVYALHLSRKRTARDATSSGEIEAAQETYDFTLNLDVLGEGESLAIYAAAALFTILGGWLLTREPKNPTARRSTQPASDVAEVPQQTPVLKAEKPAPKNPPPPLPAFERRIVDFVASLDAHEVLEEDERYISVRIESPAYGDRYVVIRMLPRQNAVAYTAEKVISELQERMGMLASHMGAEPDVVLGRIVEEHEGDLEDVATLIPPEVRLESEKEFIESHINLIPLLTSYERDVHEVILEGTDNLTLGDVYRPTRFTYRKDGEPRGPTKNTLLTHVKAWLNTRSRKQLAILGDYGTGKTTFVKYLAAELARAWMAGDEQARIPIILRQTGHVPSSPNNLEDQLSALIRQKNMRCSVRALMALVEQGRVLVIIDGFDEMRLIGDRKSRLLDFEAIWRQFDVPNNKIIFAGRPGYFPDAEELREALRTNDKGVYSDENYCQAIELTLFSPEDVRKTLLRYDSENGASHWTYIENNPSLLNVALRPAMLHLLAVTLKGTIPGDNSTSAIKTPADLLRVYTDGWITREETQGRGRLNLKEEERRAFSQALFVHMYNAGGGGRIAIETLEHIYDELLKLDVLEERDAEIRQGIITELRTCTFVRPDGDDAWTWVHKSFYEYFVADYIVTQLRGKGGALTTSSQNVLRHDQWPREIARHTADLLLAAGVDPAELSPNSNLKVSRLNARQVQLYMGLHYTKTQTMKERSVAWAKKIVPVIRWTGVLDDRLFYDGVNLNGMDLGGADLREADLGGADLFQAHLREVNLRGADLRGADLRGADLREADLRGANLRGASLFHTNLQGANLEGADLGGVTLWESKMN